MKCFEKISDVHFRSSSSLFHSAIAMLDKEVKLVADILYLGRERTPRASASEIVIIGITGWSGVIICCFQPNSLFLKNPQANLNLPVNDTIAAGHDSSSISFLRFLVRIKRSHQAKVEKASQGDQSSVKMKEGRREYSSYFWTTTTATRPLMHINHII